MYFYPKRKIKSENQKVYSKTDKTILFEIDCFIERCCQYGHYHYKNVGYESLCSAIEQLIIDRHNRIKDPCERAIGIVEIYFPSHAEWLNDDEE